MCNLSESIAEKAEIKGFDKGLSKAKLTELLKL